MARARAIPAEAEAESEAESEAKKNGFQDDYEYETFGNVQQHAFLEAFAARLEQQRFQLATELDLALIVSADEAQTARVQESVDQLTVQIARLRERVAQLPELSPDERDKLDEQKARAMLQARPDRSQRPVR